MSFIKTRFEAVLSEKTEISLAIEMLAPSKHKTPSLFTRAKAFPELPAVLFAEEMRTASV